MKPLFKRVTFVLSLFSAALLVSCDDHRLEPKMETLPDRVFYALSDDNKIHEINVKNIGTPTRSFDVTGLVAGDMLAGIDFRPATGQLYAISFQSNLYHINTKTGDQQGKATRVGGAAIATPLVGTSIGIDFNPTVDKIRIVTSTAQNLRLNPETGAVLIGDAALNGYTNPMIGAVAYTNSRAGVTAAPGVGTTLYDIDANTDKLYIQVSPNPGTLAAVGPLGLDITDVGGFDISPDIAPADVFPIASVKVQGKWELDYVNLTTGKLQKLGNFATGVNVIGIAIPSLPVAYALDGANNLRIFNPANGSEYGTKAITVPMGTMLQGIDIRPSNGRLYALGSDSKIYAVDLGSGAPSEVVALSAPLSGTQFGVDFNPVADRLRVVSDNGQNLRIEVGSGAVAPDTDVKVGMTTPFVTAVAYTNSYPGTTATTLYDIDGQSNIFYKQVPPNDGTLIDPKNLGIDVATSIGFDIASISGKGYAIFTVGGVSGFYTIDLATGVPTLLYAFPIQAKGLALGFGF